MTRQNKMATMPMGKLVANVSLPLMVSMLIQSLYNIVDGIFVAKMSESALTATSISFPVQMLMIAVSVGTGVGVNSLISRRLGQKKLDEVGKVAVTGLIMSLLCSLCFILLGIFLAKPFLQLFTDDAEILPLAVSYLQICMIFCSGIFIATIGERMLQSTGNTLLSMIAQAVGAIVNIILDPILIFGLLGLPALGIRGAAAATVIGQWSAGILSLVLNRCKNPEIKMTLRGFKMEGRTVGEIYKVGAPTILMQACGSIMVSAMNAILVGFSSTAVAFFGVYYKLYSFLYMPVSGFSQGLLPIVGFNYGAKNGARIRSALKITLGAACGFMLAGTIVFLLFPAQLIGLFSASDEMISFGIPALRTISLTFILTGCTVAIGFFFSAIGNGLVSMISTALRQLVLLVPCAYLLANAFGLSYAWYGFWVSEAAAAIFAVLCFLHSYKTKIRPIIDKNTIKSEKSA